MSTGYLDDPFDPKLKPGENSLSERVAEIRSEVDAEEAAVENQDEIAELTTNAGDVGAHSPEEAKDIAEGLVDEEFDLESPTNKTAALTLIAQAGGDPQAASSFLTDAQADFLVAFPQLAAGWAQRFPTGTTNTYGQVLQEYGFAAQRDVQKINKQDPNAVFEAFPSPLTETKELLQSAKTGKGFTVGKNGAVMFDNGVVAVTDPTTGTQNLYFPHQDVAGSPGWLSKIQKSWGSKQIKTWRKRLAKLGFIQSDTGGMAQDLLDGLSAYHRSRYLNRGKVQPMGPEEQMAVKAKDILPGKAQVGLMVRAQYQKIFQEDPSEAEEKEWTKFVTQTANHLLQTGHAPEDVANETQAKFYEAMEDDPKADFFMDSTEENTELADSLLRTVSVVNSMGRTR